ncbi:MAG: HAD family hydrolase, partial [Candidatus Caldatribacteriaceae bacterium]
YQLALWKIPMALVTAKILEEMAYDFDRFVINHLFAVTKCADDVARPKPAPDSLLVASEKLAVAKEQVIFVGESIYDIQAAKNAGIRFAFAQWGALYPQEILSLNPDYILEKPPDLLKILVEGNTRRLKETSRSFPEFIFSSPEGF